MKQKIKNTFPFTHQKLETLGHRVNVTFNPLWCKNDPYMQFLYQQGATMRRAQNEQNMLLVDGWLIMTHLRK